MGRQWRIALGVGVVLALTAGLWLLISESEDGSTDQAVRPSPTGQASRVWGQMVRKGLEEEEGLEAAWKWPFGAIEPVAEGMPGRMREETTETLGGDRGTAPLGLNFDAARYAKTPSGFEIWIVPGRGVMCIVRAPKIATSCDTKVKASQQGLLLQVYKVGEPPLRRPTDFTAMGVAPDGVVDLLAKVGPESVTIPVADNIFYYEAKTPIRIVRWTR